MILRAAPLAAQVPQALARAPGALTRRAGERVDVGSVF
jgi:hypothetical protein